LRTLTTTIDSTSAATQRKYIDFSSAKSKKNSVGRSMASGRSHWKYRGSNSSDRTATAKANVVTARNRPRIRSAGRPTTTAKAAVKATASGTASQNVRPTLAVRAPAVTAPTATKANWPRLTWPAQPVSTTSERATMAFRAMRPPRFV
jgi:hypothetical protein